MPALFPSFALALSFAFATAQAQDADTLDISSDGNLPEINIAFRKVPKTGLVHSVSSIRPNEIMQYDYVQTLTDLLEGRTLGMLGSSNLRGWGSPVYVIDGIPRDLNFLNLEDIEEITVLKDVNAAILYGNAGQNGVMMITTKRGKPLRHDIRIHGYYGLSKPLAYPRYLSSADYMEHYNLARRNDGLDEAYNEETIFNYRYSNPYRYPNVDFYSKEYLRQYRPYSKVTMETSGGNKTATYYADLSWRNQGNLLDFGYAKGTGDNLFSARGNLDIKVNKWINTSLDGAAFLNRMANANTNYWAQSAVIRPDQVAPLLPIGLMDPDNSLLKSAKNIINGHYLPGGNVLFLTNPITDVYLAGKNVVTWRNYSFNNRIDADMGWLLDGLQFHTNLSFDFINAYNENVTNAYATYQATWFAFDNNIATLEKFGEDRRDGTQRVSGIDGHRNFGVYAMFDYNKTFCDVHHVSANLLGYASVLKYSLDFQSRKNSNLGLRLAYDYAHKYMVDFSGAVVHSIKLHPDNRNAFSPSLGLAWVLSSEQFMKSLSFVNYLKMRISAGIMNTDTGINDYYLYDDSYINSGTFYWYDGNNSRPGTIPGFGPNPDLSFMKRKDVNIGLEGSLFNSAFQFEVSCFRNTVSGLLTRVNSMYPNWFTNFVPYDNYNEYLYWGYEVGLGWRKQWNDFTLHLQGNLLYNNNKITKMYETYDNKYQYRKGRPVDAIYGLEDEGLFLDQLEIDCHFPQAFGDIRPGDIRYRNQNDDLIVDDNDQKMIGRTQSPIYYGLQMRMSWKNLTLFAMATGRHGGNGFLGDDVYNNYYWVRGDYKYSAYMLNSWTEERALTATYPRLTSGAGNNNFRTSSYWLFDNSYFRLNRVQLTYRIPIRGTNLLAMKELNVFLNASNLLTLAPNREILELNIGSTPQFRSFAMGVMVNF